MRQTTADFLERTMYVTLVEEEGPEPSVLASPYSDGETHGFIIETNNKVLLALTEEDLMAMLDLIALIYHDSQ